MSVKNIWSVLCRDILVDQETNSVSYIRCIEEASASEFPTQINSAYLGSLWEKEGEEPEQIGFRVALLSPSKKKNIIVQTKPITFNRLRHRLHFRLNSIELYEFGNHNLLLEWQTNKYWTKVVQIPLYIRDTS